MRSKLAWLTDTRPDISCAVAKLTQVREGEFNFEAIKESNPVVRHVKKETNLGIVHPHLDPESTEIIAFSDAPSGTTETFQARSATLSYFAIAMGQPTSLSTPTRNVKE